jgi:hypothetical protein
MRYLCFDNAKLIKLFIVLVCNLLIYQKTFSQDPITDAVRNEKQGTEGILFNSDEQRKLDRINKKFGVTEKEKELRIKQESGSKLKFFERIKIGRASRKDYMREKKILELRKEVFLNRQNEETRNRLIENEKRLKKRDKEIKRKQKRKRFFNLFR